MLRVLSNFTIVLSCILILSPHGITAPNAPKASDKKQLSKTVKKELKTNPNLVQVETLKVKPALFSERLKYPALVTPEIQGRLTSEIQGTVTRIVRPLGSQIKRGQIVFYVKNSQIGLNFNEYAVRSPVSGVVSKLMVEIGQLVKTGSSLGEVTNLKKLKFIIQAPAKDLNVLKLGLKAVFKYNDQNFTARVTALSPVVDEKTGTARLELTPTKPVNYLRSGVIGQAEISLPEKNIILLPPKALFTLANNYFVKTVTSENKISYTAVKVGKLLDGQQVISSGLKAGDEVVIHASDFVKDGEVVQRKAPSQKKS